MQFERHFTVGEAQATLPLVKRIVDDIQKTGRSLRQKIANLGADADGHPEVERLIRELEELGGELKRIGCDYKDPSFSLGLVDFPAVIEGEEVLLCWRTDEPEIAYYHGIEEGYPGRRPIPEAYRGSTGGKSGEGREEGGQTDRERGERVRNDG